MRRHALVLLLLVLGLGTAVWFLVGREDERPEAPEARSQPAAEPPAERPVALTAPLPAPEPSHERIVGGIAFPDGTYLPPLNGVREAPELSFHPRQTPFAKVVGRMRDANGREWYVHENGVRSTTYFDSTGRAIGEVVREVKALPIDPGLGK